MKKQTAPETLTDILEAAIKTPKSYQDLIEDGAAIERLQQDKDFSRYQRLLAEAYIQLVERLRLSDPATLPALQGALVQHSNIMKLPGNVLKIATQLVEQRRNEREQESVNA